MVPLEGALAETVRPVTRKAAFMHQRSCLSGVAGRSRARALAAQRAFSLVELLMVIAIILLLAVFTLPSIRGISGGINLTGSGEEIVSMVNLARQRASTFNREVALRFFRTDSSAPFTAYQLWEQQNSADPASWVGLDNFQRLPAGIVVSGKAAFSPILNVASFQGQVMMSGSNMLYSDVLFLPSGSIAAQTEVAFTLVMEHAPTTGGIVPGLPSNFATISIEPINARPVIYRP